jgi:hypothetical protein
MCEEPGGGYWQGWRSFVESGLLKNGMIDEADLSLFHLTDQADDAVREILAFYQCYHSSRFVGDQLVFRLNQRLTDETLSEINESFADIITQGRFEQLDGPLEGEEGAYPDKPRLVFAFDRRSAGRLRMLIDKLNGRA